MHLDDAGFNVEAAPLRRSVLEHEIGLAWLVEDAATAYRVIGRGSLTDAIRRKESVERAGWTAGLQISGLGSEPTGRRQATRLRKMLLPRPILRPLPRRADRVAPVGPVRVPSHRQAQVGKEQLSEDPSAV